MRNRMTPYTKRLFLELADGEWHSIDEIYEIVGSAVPSERRQRLLERLRRQHPNGQYTSDSVGLQVAQTTVASFVSGGAIDRVDRQIRITDEGQIRVLKAQGYDVHSPQRTRQSPATKKLYEILADGEWHDQEEVLQQIMPLVPPEKAYRVSMRQRESAARRRGHGTDVTRGDPHRTGARTFARGILMRARQNGGILAEGDKIRASLPGTMGYRIR